MKKAINDGTWEAYPCQHWKTIEKDVSRTFLNEPFFTDSVRESVKTILRCYVFRNSTVGYIQGMSHLVFRIRQFLNEEDSFWAFCMIVECYMPPDHYVDMYGALMQADILSRVFR